MVIPAFFLLAALAPAPAQLPDGRPLLVSVQTAPRGPATIRVTTANDGYLIVLHRSTAGRVDVLFPARPDGSGFARAGTYEIASDGADPILTEVPGRGTVLAALSDQPLRSAEFTHYGEWSSDALAAAVADNESGLTEVVQRMAGDESFNYDVATYLIAPEPAPAPVDLVVVGVPVPVATVTQVIVCPPLRLIALRRHELPRAAVRAARAPASVPAAPAIALYERGRLAASGSASAGLPPVVVVQPRSRPEDHALLPVAAARSQPALAAATLVTPHSVTTTFISVPLRAGPAGGRALPVVPPVPQVQNPAPVPQTARAFALPHAPPVVVNPPGHVSAQPPRR